LWGRSNKGQQALKKYCAARRADAEKVSVVLMPLWKIMVLNLK